jgi:hypothetical protein
MTKTKHPLDQQIIVLLQSHGLIKSEAKARLKKEVYKLLPSEIQKVDNYTTHFGLHNKQQLIDEILNIRRENMLLKLSARPL